jgi:hypothetical protein
MLLVLLLFANSFQAISVIRGVRYGVFTNKKHALNTLKMDCLLTAFKLCAIGDARIYFSLAKQRVNFLQKY